MAIVEQEGFLMKTYISLVCFFPFAVSFPACLEKTLGHLQTFNDCQRMNKNVQKSLSLSSF